MRQLSRAAIYLRSSLAQAGFQAPDQARLLRRLALRQCLPPRLAAAQRLSDLLSHLYQCDNPLRMQHRHFNLHL